MPNERYPNLRMLGKVQHLVAIVCGIAGGVLFVFGVWGLMMGPRPPYALPRNPLMENFGSYLALSGVIPALVMAFAFETGSQKTQIEIDQAEMLGNISENLRELVRLANQQTGDIVRARSYLDELAATVRKK